MAVRHYACPRCFLVVPGLLELDLVDGVRDIGRTFACHECAGELIGAAAIDPRFIVEVLGERGAPLPLRGHVRAVNE